MLRRGENTPFETDCKTAPCNYYGETKLMGENAVKENCPDAWVINYTNPMTLCVKTLYRVFPEIKAFGCCHEVFGTQKVLSFALDKILGIKDVTVYRRV